MKYYIGYIASWKGDLCPMVYSEKRKNVESVLSEWSDRETKIERMEDTDIASKLMRKYPQIELTGLKHV